MKINQYLRLSLKQATDFDKRTRLNIPGRDTSIKEIVFKW